MEVKFVSSQSTLSYGASEADDDADPYSQFQSHRVQHTKKLKPYVDSDVPLAKFPRVRRKSRSKKGGKGKEENVPRDAKLPQMQNSASLPSLPSIARGRVGAMAFVNSDSSKQHRLPQRSFPQLLSCPFKHLPNMSPSQTSDVNVYHALQDFANGEFSTAVKRLNRAISQDSRNFVPKFIRGLCFAALKRFELAHRDFSGCCKIEESALAYFNRGVAMSNLFNYPRAIRNFSKAISIDKTESDFYKNRALLYRRNGDYRLAQKDYQTLRSLSMLEAGVGEGVGAEMTFVDSSPFNSDASSTSISYLAEDSSINQAKDAIHSESRRNSSKPGVILPKQSRRKTKGRKVRGGRVRSKMLLLFSMFSTFARKSR